MKKKIETLEKIFFSLQMFLLVFNICNKDFFFNVHIKYMIFILAIINILFACLRYKQKVVHSRIFLFIITFYLIAFASDIGFDTSYLLEEEQIIVNHLKFIYLYNLVNIISIYLNSSRLNGHSILQYMKFSMFYLFISMIGSMFENSLRIIDSNYATVISIIFMVMLLVFEDRKMFQSIFLLLSVMIIAFSFSKPILLTLIPILFMTFILSKIKNDKEYKIVSIFMIVFVFLLPILFYQMRLFADISIMQDRYDTWSSALTSFFKNPISGNGTGSLRVYLFETMHQFIQTYSTILQILSEHGILALLIFSVIIYYILQKKQPFITFLIFTYLVWASYYETVYLNFFILVIALIPNLKKLDTKIYN